MKKKTVILLILFSVCFISAGEKYIDFELIKKAGEPRFVKDGVLFTLPQAADKRAFLRTDMDNWKNSYYFKKSLYNILYLFLPLNENIKNIRYRININGYWSTDPNNPNVVEDDIGNELSLIEIESDKRYFSENPVIHKEKESPAKVVFRYYNQKAKEVNFVTSVDNWNEYSNRMIDLGGGLWEITKYYTSGKYFYYYLVDGKKMVDLDNSKIFYSPEKGQIGYFIIK